MAFVLDSSISAVWALSDESSQVAERALDRLTTEIAQVPPIWWYEIRNLLIVSERRHRIATDDSALFLEMLASYPIRIEPIQDETATLRFARRYQLSVYDAAYLALAHRLRVPLATLDSALAAAARSEGVPLLE